MISNENPAAFEESTPRFGGTKGLRVLVADDNRESNDQLAAMIHAWGHDVQTACEGASALVLASAYRPDVVLIDLQLPKLDGSHLARALRQQPQFQDALLIVKIAWTEEERRLFCQRNAFTLFNLVVIKPIDPSLLKNLLLLERHRLTTPSRRSPIGQGGRTEAPC